ncbi:hypothetical protein LZ554_003593 [Drepanopeziza brunnea f. sp. 'monogermtubi']|nr:hypothetical protein LZ554_003593 [Drepanopeziza brunnea f. sp. 'monogermtubi']
MMRMWVAQEYIARSSAFCFFKLASFYLVSEHARHSRAFKILLTMQASNPAYRSDSHVRPELPFPDSEIQIGPREEKNNRRA